MFPLVCLKIPHNYKKKFLTTIKKILLVFFTEYKNEHKEYIFSRQKIKKALFTKNKKTFQIDDIDVNKVLVSKIEPYGTKNALKYFIGYNDDVIRPLC